MTNLAQYAFNRLQWYKILAITILAIMIIITIIIMHQSQGPLHNEY